MNPFEIIFITCLNELSGHINRFSVTILSSEVLLVDLHLNIKLSIYVFDLSKWRSKGCNELLVGVYYLDFI
jgi:hypothetical protein